MLHVLRFQAADCSHNMSSSLVQKYTSGCNRPVHHPVRKLRLSGSKNAFEVQNAKSDGATGWCSCKNCLWCAPSTWELRNKLFRVNYKLHMFLYSCWFTFSLGVAILKFELFVCYDDAVLCRGALHQHCLVYRWFACTL